MVRLGKENLKTILEGAKFIAVGSSRAVYEITYNNRPCIVKLAFDKCGYNQNEAEMKVWNKYGHLGVFNEVLANYSNKALIFPKVNVINSDTIEAYDNGITYQDSYNLKLDNCLNAKNIADNVLGWSIDNYQIGENAKGEFVLYDYGLPVNEIASVMEYVGNLDDQKIDYVKKFLNYVFI